MRTLLFATAILVSCTSPAVDELVIVEEEEEIFDDEYEDYFADDELGVEIDEFDWTSPPMSMNEDGEEVYAEDAKVTVKGKGTHTVLVEYWGELDENDQITDVEILVVTDKTMGQVREYRYDPAMTSLTISEADGENGVELIRNPDGTYTVDGESAAGGKEAIALLQDYSVYTDASPHGIIVSYAVCQTCLERQQRRTPMCCNCNTGGPSRQNEVAICDVFPEFCDCLACDKLNKTECSRCQ